MKSATNLVFSAMVLSPLSLLFGDLWIPLQFRHASIFSCTLLA
jgi:hypothetical protein